MRSFVAPVTAIDKLKALNRTAMQWLQHSETFDTAAEFFTDALNSYMSFFTQADFNALFDVLTGPWAVSTFQEVLGGEGETDPLLFVRLIIAFAEALVAKLEIMHGDVRTQTLLQMMHTMLSANGYPVVEDEISPQTFEFWSSLIEFLLDAELQAEYEDGFHMQSALVQGKSHIFQAIQEYWSKIKIPPAAVADTWSKDLKEGFTSFRKDFADLLQLAYPLLHAPLFTKFVSHILTALPAQDWEVSGSEASWVD